MKTIEKEIIINASKEAVWKMLLEDENYRKWTSVFCKGSRAETDWQEGSRVYFKSDEPGGLISEVACHVPNEKIVIHHIGVINEKGEEEYEGEEAKKWIGQNESYFVKEENNKTVLTILQGTDDSYFEFMDKMWDEGLKKLKEMCEA